MKISLKGYFKPTPSRVKKVLLSIKAVIGLAAGYQFIIDRPLIALLTGVFGAIINEIAQFIYVPEDPQP